MSGDNGSNGNKPVGVLEVVLLARKYPDLRIEPCFSTGCHMRIPECRERDGLGHTLGNASAAMCYLKQRAVEVVSNGSGEQ